MVHFIYLLKYSDQRTNELIETKQTTFPESLQQNSQYLRYFIDGSAF